MVNNLPIIRSISESEDNPRPVRPTPRKRVTSDPVLPERLPTTSVIQREADLVVPKIVLEQLRHSPTPPLSPDLEDATSQSAESDKQPDQDEQDRHRRTLSFSSLRSPTAVKSVKEFFQSKNPVSNAGWREPQPFEVLRAVESRDVMYLMEIRDKAFPLLLHKSGDTTPLLHALRIGKSHRDVAIVLLGAFSRWVNYLTDQDVQQPKTKMLLKRLRTNLKLAIDAGLAREQTDLIASFLQVIIMSEGDRWVWNQVNDITLALRASSDGFPVKSAEAAVRKFTTRELGKASLIAAVEDYVANATTDLLMMAAWSLVCEVVPGDPIPASYFARDDRVYKAFIDLLEPRARDIHLKCSKRLKWQLRVLRTVMEGRSTSNRTKVSLLAGELDEGHVS